MADDLTEGYMALISIKRYLDLDASHAYGPTLELLATIVSQDSFVFDQAGSERFNAEIARILEAAGSEVDLEHFTTAVEAIQQAVQRHNQSVTALVRRQSDELQNMVVMLTQAIRNLGSASEISASNLDAIAADLKQVSAVKDILRLRLRLSECLKKLCDESAREKAQSQGNIAVLQEKLDASQQRLSRYRMASDVDRVTGFAGRSTAEAAIQQLIDGNETSYVVVAVLERLQTINAMFGYAVGDELLCQFASAMAGHMASRAVFYRWSGPAVVGVLSRAVPIHIVRAEIGNVLSEIPISKSLTYSHQNAFVTTTAASLVLPVAAPASTLFVGIDNFVAAKTQEKSR